MIKNYKVDPNTRSYKHGYSRHTLYRVWLNMNERCYNKNHKFYYRYGNRGITVCEAWRRKNESDFQSLENFINWSENKWKKGLTLDRKDNNKGYFPNNCKFVTRIENQNNREITALIKKGKYKGLSFSEFWRQSNSSISYNCAKSRFLRGFSLEDCIEENHFAQKGSIKIGNRGSSHGASKLNEKKVLRIKELLAEGIFQKEIAKKYNVSRASIGKIKNGSMWGWLKEERC